MSGGKAVHFPPISSHQEPEFNKDPWREPSSTSFSFLMTLSPLFSSSSSTLFIQEEEFLNANSLNSSPELRRLDL
jgi:hypothetical protein